jgi:hypothetical protein
MGHIFSAVPVPGGGTGAGGTADGLVAAFGTRATWVSGMRREWYSSGC